MSHKNLSQSEAVDALRAVQPPGFSRDIISFGMVRNLQVTEGTVSFGLSVGAQDPAFFEAIAGAAREALRRAGAVEVRIARADPPVSTGAAPGAPAGMTGGGPAAGGVLQKRPIPGVAHTIAVASGKGGVGKSTVAVNLAAALRTRGLRVGLMDADIYGPSIPLMMGAHEVPKPNPEKNAIEPLDRHGIRLISIGFFIDAGRALIWRGPMVMKAVKQFLEDVDWGDLDVLVIDLPPGTGDAQLTLVQLVPLTGAVIVTTPQEVALIDARKAVSMFQETSCDILGIVENMSRFVCPHCEKETDIFDHGGGEAEAGRLGVPFLGAIPIDPRVREGGDAGRPIVFSHPDSPVSRAFLGMADRVSERIREIDVRDGRFPAGEHSTAGSRWWPFGKKG